MSILTMESQMAGMPSGRKKTRRAGKSHRAHKGPPGDPKTHLQNVQAALQADDHATAKTHAFALMRSLHAKTQASAPMTAPPLSPPQSLVPQVEPQDNPSRASSERLAKTLKGLGK